MRKNRAFPLTPRRTHLICDHRYSKGRVHDVLSPQSRHSRPAPARCRASPARAIELCPATGTGRQPHHHPCQRLYGHRWRGAQPARRHGRAVVRERGLRARRTGRSGLSPDARTALLQHLLPHRDAPAGRTGRASGRAAGQGTRRRIAAHLLQFERVGIERHRVPPRADLLDAQGPGRPQRLHQPPQRLPRIDRRLGQPWRHGFHACAGRPADPRHRTCDAALSVRRGLWRRPGSVRRPRGAGHRGPHPGHWPRKNRRLHRRAGPGRRRRDHPAPPATGRRSRRSAANMASCSSPTK